MAIVIGLVTFQLLRPLPTIAATTLLPASMTLGATPPALPWPTTGSAALSVPGLGTIGTHGPQTAVPLASTAKIMTGLVILADHPLRRTEQGRLVPVTAAHVAIYLSEKNDGQSVFPVAAGEHLSEYQALQALLIPSGNIAGLQPAQLFGAIMGLPTLDDVFTSNTSLLNAVGPVLHYASVLSTNQVIAEYQAP